MTAQQKIDRLMARVGRLQAQANAQANAQVNAQVDEDQAAAMAALESLPDLVTSAMANFDLPKAAIAAFEASIAPVFDAAPAAKSTYYSYFASSCSRVFTTAKSAVVGAGVLAKKAATAVCWKAPKWLITTTVRFSAAVYSSVVAAAPTVKEVGLFGLQFAIAVSAMVAVGQILVSPFGLAMLVGGAGIGFLGYLAAAKEERRAAYYAERYAS